MMKYVLYTVTVVLIAAFLTASMTSTMKNPSVVLYGPEDIRLVDTPIPEPREGEVLVKIHSVGVCGTDMHIWQSGTVADFSLSHPYIMGHEGSGVVTKLGPGVTQLKEGDGVALDPASACGECRLCKSGNYHVCHTAKLSGIPTTDGFLARYIVHKAKLCYKLPIGFPLEQAAFMEPLSVSVHACKRANVKLASKVLVTGAGSVGIAAAMVAKAMGAGEVCITDINKNRLELAHKLGVTYTVLCDTTDTEVLRQRIEEKFGQKPDISIECSGAQAALTLACITTEWSGVVAMVGLGTKSLEIPIELVVSRGIDLLGIRGSNDTFRAAIQVASTRAVDVGAIISHRFPVGDALKAFKLVRHCAGETLKVLIQFPE